MGIRAKKEPSVRARVEALEDDVCKWIEENQSLPYEKQRDEIIASFLGLGLSPQMLLELATHMLIRMGQAHFVIQRERKLEPLISCGYKNLRSRRKNASKERNGGKIKHLESIRKIIQKEKKRDTPFKNFLTNALNGSVEDLEIKSISNKRYRVSAESFDWIEASEGTIQAWFSSPNKKKQK